MIAIETHLFDRVNLSFPSFWLFEAFASATGSTVIVKRFCVPVVCVEE